LSHSVNPLCVCVHVCTCACVCVCVCDIFEIKSHELFAWVGFEL
jgi:hypothetical protein